MWVLMPGNARRLARSVRLRSSFLKIRSSVSFRPTTMSVVTAPAPGGGPGGALNSVPKLPHPMHCPRRAGCIACAAVVSAPDASLVDCRCRALAGHRRDCRPPPSTRSRPSGQRLFPRWPTWRPVRRRCGRAISAELFEAGSSSTLASLRVGNLPERQTSGQSARPRRTHIKRSRAP